MKIQLFKNMKGIIFGGDPKRVGCETAGILKIGNTQIEISPGKDAIMPILFHGCTGDYAATFTTPQGLVYTLAPVVVRNGYVLPPSSTAVELMELHCRADAADSEMDNMREQIKQLSEIFDTNSLNFLIK